MDIVFTHTHTLHAHIIYKVQGFWTVSVSSQCLPVNQDGKWPTFQQSQDRTRDPLCEASGTCPSPQATPHPPRYWRDALQTTHTHTHTHTHSINMKGCIYLPSKFFIVHPQLKLSFWTAVFSLSGHMCTSVHICKQLTTYCSNNNILNSYNLL